MERLKFLFFPFFQEISRTAHDTLGMTDAFKTPTSDQLISENARSGSTFICRLLCISSYLEKGPLDGFQTRELTLGFASCQFPPKFKSSSF